MVREEETIDNYLLPDLCHQQALLKLVLETRHQQYLLGRNTRTGYHTKEIVLLTQVSHRNLEACTKKKNSKNTVYMRQCMPAADFHFKFNFSNADQKGLSVLSWKSSVFWAGMTVLFQACFFSPTLVRANPEATLNFAESLAFSKTWDVPF